MHQIGQARRKPPRQFLQRRLHGLCRRHRIGAGRQINADRHARTAVDPRFAVKVLCPDLDAGDVADPQYRAVGIGPQHDVAKLPGIGQPALRLHVELKLLLVADRPGTDAADRRLHALSLDRRNDVGGGQIEAGEPLRIEPYPHRIVHLGEQLRLTNTWRARDRIEDVDDGVVGDEQWILFTVLAVEHDELQHRRRFLLYHQALLLHFGWQLRQRGLHTVVDVDGVDVRIGTECKRDGKCVAAVVTAGRLHVECTVDADDLRFQRLGDACFDHRRGGARKYTGDRYLWRNDIGKLRHRNLHGRQPARNGNNERDDNRETGTIDKDR